jgi:addiction module HigA family antidote
MQPEEIQSGKLKPIYPGEVLLDEFLKPMDLNSNQLALALQLPPPQIEAIILGQQPMTEKIAQRLAHHFQMSAGFWLGLQQDYDRDFMADLSIASSKSTQAEKYQTPSVRSSP